jgi:multimeric flavodoxin WrbA
MNIIGFIGSPRKDGNTAWLVNKILEVAKEKGAETHPWYCGGLDIKPCRGCLACHKGGSVQGCVINDDMQKLYEEIESADALVLGSPIYMGQMSGQAKIFTDRLFAHISPRFSPYYKEKAVKKKLVLAFTQGNPDSGKFQAYYDYTKNMFQLLEFDVKDVVVVTGTRNEPAGEKKGLHTKIKSAGAALVCGDGCTGGA